MGFPCIICLSEFLFRPTELIPTVGILPLTSYSSTEFTFCMLKLFLVLLFRSSEYSNHYDHILPVRPLRPIPTSSTIFNQSDHFDQLYCYIFPYGSAEVTFCMLFQSCYSYQSRPVRSYLTSFTAPFSQFAQSGRLANSKL